MRLFVVCSRNEGKTRTDQGSRTEGIKVKSEFRCRPTYIGVRLCREFVDVLRGCMVSVTEAEGGCGYGDI